jgi:hypothetical protein
MFETKPARLAVHAGENQMTLFRTKLWSVLDTAKLEWSSVLVGMLAGVLFSSITKWVVRLVALLAILLAIKPAIDYFKDEEA